MSPEVLAREIVTMVDESRRTGLHECFYKHGGCSFNPTSMSDFCDLHRPGGLEKAIAKLLTKQLAEVRAKTRRAK